MSKDLEVKFGSRELLFIADLYYSNLFIGYLRIGARGLALEKIFRIALPIMLENVPLQNRRFANFILDGQEKTSIHDS